MKKSASLVREKKSNRKKPSVSSEVPLGLNFKFYRSLYSDLTLLTDNQLTRHWKTFGIKEGRLGAIESLLTDDNSESINHGLVDLNFYLSFYPDLSASGIFNQLQATVHYFKEGKKEHRIPNFEKWVEAHSLEKDIFFDDTIRCAVKHVCSQDGGPDINSLLDMLLGEKILPIKLDLTDIKTSRIYEKISKLFLVKGDIQRARDFLSLSLTFNKTARNFELIGNTYLDEENYHTAISYYNESLKLEPNSYWSVYNRNEAYLRSGNVEGAFSSLVKSIQDAAQYTQFLDMLDSLAERLWNLGQNKVNALVESGNREAIIALNLALSKKIYQAYLNISGVDEHPALSQVNVNRILIVGDHHVPQCIRYRISQKVEQLELAGKQVTVIDWVNLSQEMTALASHDVVIFYRVPAVPLVLKAMAQTNATGKLSIYEIDDLLFEAVYPPSLESYGGYVDLKVYQDLVKSMGLFNSAARFCRIGLASTRSLVKRLGSFVFGQECLLHRNGFDSLNKFTSISEYKKDTIDIFYGSGTQAHNTDFVEIALPAIEKVLDQYSSVRLIVVGYLKLPKDFIQKYKNQLEQIPPIDKIQSYWSLLAQADINIAVLHNDEINDCKSELKWFEAACFGVPSVVSSTENYRDVIRHSEDGYMVATQEQWYQTLIDLIQDPVKRYRVGKNAADRVKKEYALNVLGDRFIKDISDYVRGEAVNDIALTQRKKVALVNVFFPPQSIGGATRVVADNFDILVDQYGEDYEICIFTADAECRDPHQLTVYNYKKTRVYRVATLWRENMDWHPKDPVMYDIFCDFLELEKPDLVHFHCVQRLSASIVEAAKNMRVPYIVTVHDAWWISDFQFLVDESGKVYPEGHLDPFSQVALPKNISLSESIERRIYLKSLLAGAKQVITVSDAFADIYRKNGILNIAVTKNGISSAIAWPPKITNYSDRVICGHIGGMSAHKGYDLLKSAVLSVQPKNLEFLVVDHSKPQGYESAEYWGDITVTFVGRMSQTSIPTLYRQIDVLFAPSIWPESFGLVTREAAACRCWVVASNLGGIGEDVVNGENGLIIDPSQESIELALAELDSNPSRYKELVADTSISSVEDQVQLLLSYYND